jgi:hypothetical protein
LDVLANEWEGLTGSYIDKSNYTFNALFIILFTAFLDERVENGVGRSSRDRLDLMIEGAGS